MVAAEVAASAKLKRWSVRAWPLVQVEISFKDGEPVTEKAVYEFLEAPLRLRVVRIDLEGAEWVTRYDNAMRVP